MKKIIPFILYFFSAAYSSFAQDSSALLKKVKLHYQAIIKTDSGEQKGFLGEVTDSAILLSSRKKIMYGEIPSAYYVVPAENIRILTVKNKRFPLAEMTAGAVLGFVLTAGLWENEDINEDGKLSFWELLFGAIDGATSQNRERRRAALWVGAGGGVAGLLLGAFTGRKLSITFPLDGRRNFLKNNQFKIHQFQY